MLSKNDIDPEKKCICIFTEKNQVTELCLPII